MEEQQKSKDKLINRRTIEPPQFSVVLHNDDFTTMEFVVMVLCVVFKKSEAEAEELMMRVHKNGQAVAGVYSYDIPMTKAQKATRMARENKFPLRLTVEQV